MTEQLSAYRQFSTVARGVAAAMKRAVASAADLWRTGVVDQAGKYRPEDHYMRGPGPKCHAKACGPKDIAGPR